MVGVCVNRIGKEFTIMEWVAIEAVRWRRIRGSNDLAYCVHTANISDRLIVLETDWGRGLAVLLDRRVRVGRWFQ